MFRKIINIIGIGIIFIALLFITTIIFHKNSSKTKNFSTPLTASLKLENNNFINNLPEEAPQEQDNQQKEQDKQNKILASFLLVGIPGLKNPAPNLTDTIIAAFVKNDKLIMISIPRDLFVKTPQNNYWTKINSVYPSYGIEGLKSKVEDIVGQPLNDHFLINLDALKAIIDNLGGINVLIEKDINDPSFPDSNYSYEHFQLQSGWRWLNGETAMKFVRTRNDIDGDFSRMKRQQELLQAIKRKVLSLNPFWDFGSILKVATETQKNINTSLNLKDTLWLWKIIKNIPSDNIQSFTIDRNLLKGETTLLGANQVSILVPKAGREKYEDIRIFVKNILAK